MSTLKSFLMSLLCLIFCTQVLALRCGNQIISIGDTQTKVLTACGKPMKITKVKAKKHKGGSISQTQWLYNFGAQDFIYQLTFSKGEVMDVETLGYGN